MRFFGSGCKKRSSDDEKKAPSGRELLPQATEGDCVRLNNKKARKAPSIAKAVPLPLGGRHMHILVYGEKRFFASGCKKRSSVNNKGKIYCVGAGI